jgi:hypothetical protein
MRRFSTYYLPGRLSFQCESRGLGSNPPLSAVFRIRSNIIVSDIWDMPTFANENFSEIIE